VRSNKEDNKKLMREKSHINSQVMQRLNQLQRKTNNGSKNKEEGIMKEEITTKELVIQEMLEEIIETTHLLTQ